MNNGSDVGGTHLVTNNTQSITCMGRYLYLSCNRDILFPGFTERHLLGRNIKKAMQMCDSSKAS